MHRSAFEKMGDRPHAGVELQLLQDRVEVLDIETSAIEKTPSFGVSVNTDFILGMGKSDDGVNILLDITAVLADANLDQVSGLVEQGDQT